jgi:uncharacterized protein (DUF2249 family)
MAATLIDVPRIPPAQRHALIFSTFDALPLNDALELVNDHDPAPLRAQFASRRPGQFDWAYLQAGPERWHVRIARTAVGEAAGEASECCACACRGG